MTKDNQIVDSLIIDLLHWIDEGKSYNDVMNAWRTSCPKLPIWEEANSRKYITQNNKIVTVTELGKKFIVK